MDLGSSIFPLQLKFASLSLCGLSLAVYAAPLSFSFFLPFFWGGSRLAGTLAEFDAEINEGDTSLWSWVDALFMAMNTWSRIGSVTGDQKYFDQQFKLFSAAALEG